VELQELAFEQRRRSHGGQGNDLGLNFHVHWNQRRGETQHLARTATTITKTPNIYLGARPTRASNGGSIAESYLMCCGFTKLQLRDT
jgi:hypothetical protein